MASSNKTTNLGLSQWLSTDSPKRSDFVSDNNIIDNILGNHINDANLHLSADEKTRVSEPYIIYTAYGSGEESTYLNVGFTPTLVFIFKKNAPFTEYSDSQTVVNSCVATSVGTTGGAIIEDNKVYLYQQEDTKAKILYNLNEKTAEYIVIVFR